MFVDVDIPSGVDISRWIYEKVEESDALIFFAVNDRSASHVFTGFAAGLAVRSRTPMILIAAAGGFAKDVLPVQAQIEIKDGESDALRVAQRISEIVTPKLR